MRRRRIESNPQRAWLAIGAAALCAGVAVAQQGQPPEEPPAQRPDLREMFRMPPAAAPESAPAPAISILLDRLDDDDFLQREEATQALREHAEELEAALKAGRIDPASLGPEQRVRVSGVLETHFYETPRAGLGVQFAQGPQDADGVALQRVLGEFPASRVLAPGDEIVTVDGVELQGMPNPRAMEILRAMIIARSPGETLPMTIRRGAARVDLDVELGDFRDLGNGASPQETDLIRAWEMHKTRLGLADRFDGRIETTLSRRDWPTNRSQSRIDPAASMFAGGTSQTANIGLLAQGLPLPQNPRRSQNLARNEPRLGEHAERELDERRQALRAQVEQLQLLARLTEQRANDLNANEARRREAAMRLVQIRARIADLRQQLERLEQR